MTIENEWHGNRPNISCIPAGTYFCRRLTTSKAVYTDNPDGWTYRLDTEAINKVNHYKRTHIDFHPGNTHLDTLGCILPVTSVGMLWDHRGQEKVWGGYKSQRAHLLMLETLKRDPQFQLNILPIMNENIDNSG